MPDPDCCNKVTVLLQYFDDVASTSSDSLWGERERVWLRKLVEEKGKGLAMRDYPATSSKYSNRTVTLIQQSGRYLVNNYILE